MTFGIVRKANNSDRETIVDIFNFYVKEGFAAYPDTPVPPGFFDILCHDMHTCIVIEDNGHVVGFCILRPLLPFSTFANVATISTFIESSFRYKGYGKTLLDHIEAEAKSRQISLLLANISSKNEESYKFHVKHGFRECGRFHGAGYKFDTPFDLVWMEKALLKETGGPGK